MNYFGTRDKLLACVTARLLEITDLYDAANVIVSDQPVPERMPETGSAAITLSFGTGQFDFSRWDGAGRQAESGQLIVAPMRRTDLAMPGRSTKQYTPDVGLVSRDAYIVAKTLARTEDELLWTPSWEGEPILSSGGLFMGSISEVGPIHDSNWVQLRITYPYEMDWF